ncbi:DNA primase [Actinomadura harenae]|uniref:DNA primase n=1 Tax=Actinomadura harenae TaxID=2483351 RepID=A0A3M2MEM6_9ACTN|nr:DNA primase [Actinomadura harenae]RMI47075.1 DNA primase [Actinomadura harenae]
MAGRIRNEDIALVRERSSIDAVIGEFLQLRSAGGGNLKGLCPFHDEKSPSFNVTPARGLWYCFGCGAGGDVIKFVQEIDHLTFSEAVERLAAKAGIHLRYEEGGAFQPRQETGQRARLVEAHRVAAEYFAENLRSPEGMIGRRFLSGRGFEAADAERFGVGFAPREWEALVRHLRGRGFADAEMITAGLAKEGRRGPMDRFRGRLMWPIRDLSGDVVGFGARKLYDDDEGPKYLNTPETPLFHKSNVLYGADLAKKEIARSRQAVVVEGYTDVMACHLSGVPTAVATCGTSFGDEHIKILRRLLMDQDEFRGEVIFTFDGDAAGQKAALRAFEGEQKFVTQTFVAVQPDGLDPCDLRVQHGEAAVRDLVASRTPLFEFVVRSRIGEHDLNTTEGRLAALDAAAPIVARIKDRALRQMYAVNLDRWLGIMDERFVLQRVRELSQREHARRGAQGPGGQQRQGGNGQGQGQHPGSGQRGGQGGRGNGGGYGNGQGGGRQGYGNGGQGGGRQGYGGGGRQGYGGGEAGPNGSRGHGGYGSQGNGGYGPSGSAGYGPPGQGRDEPATDSGRPETPAFDPHDPGVVLERELLKLVVQRPAVVGPGFDLVPGEAFLVPAHATVRGVIGAAGGVASAADPSEWISRLLEQAANTQVKDLITMLAVEQTQSASESDDRYAAALLARIQERLLTRQIGDVKSKLGRLNPAEQAEDYHRLFGDLVALEQQRRVLRERGLG